jgi:hypothetical protein
MRFGGEFGIISKFLNKESIAAYRSYSVIPHFISQGFGLVGFFLLPAFLGGAIYFLTQIKKLKNEYFLLSCLVYFYVVLIVLLFVGIHSGAYIYELFFPATILLVYVIDIFKNNYIKYGFLIFLFITTYSQSLMYNVGYKPPLNFLYENYNFILHTNEYRDACFTLWCPFHFDEPKNLGVKTLGLIVREHLDSSPVPFVSLERNYYIQPKEVFFYSIYRQGPTIHIGRRITDTTDKLDNPKIIAVFTDNLLKQFPQAADEQVNKKVYEYIFNHKDYRLVATVIKNNISIIEVYEKNSTKSLKYFPIEIYDKVFDQKFSNLKNLSHIDLGS